MTVSLKILFLAAEADPFVKVGGLGDVVGSLPGALVDLHSNLDVRLILPLHRAIDFEYFRLQFVMAFTVTRSGEEIPVKVFQTEHHQVPVYFISGDPISGSARVYDIDAVKDGEKYTFFCVAALEFIQRLGWRPNIVHANDWHCGPALYEIRRRQDDPFWKGVKTLLSVHNLGYMGAGAESALSAYGLPPVGDSSLPWWGQQTPLPVGLWSADEIAAVSPTYAKEIQTPEYGCGLEHFLQSRGDSVTGIVNGIDVAAWDPNHDVALAKQFSMDHLADRFENKKLLQEKFGIEISHSVPLLGMVTRMDHQKGVDIALDALRQISDLNWQAVLLGTGNSDLEDLARQLELDFPQRVRAVIRFDGKLSRQIYAGVDMLLMPSRYEPCGLAQMIAMRYGAVPVARSTGGLGDTITDGVTGYLFTDASPDAMARALRTAISSFKKPEVWANLQKAGMRKDFSWSVSARQYVDLYRSLAARVS